MVQRYLHHFFIPQVFYLDLELTLKIILFLK